MGNANITVNARLQGLHENNEICGYNISSVQAIWSEEDECYIAVMTATAPDMSSFNLDENSFNVQVTATAPKGNHVVDKNDETLGSQCKLRVFEREKPVANIIKPSANGALLKEADLQNFSVIVEVYDAPAGYIESSNVFKSAGIDTKSLLLIVKRNGEIIEDAENDVTISKEVKQIEAGAVEVITGVYQPERFEDGSYVVTLQVTDNDGNDSILVQRDFIIDTTPPSLNITSPSEGDVIVSNSVRVEGTSDIINAQGISLEWFKNDQKVGSGIADISEGSFSYLIENLPGSGDYEIVVTATDTAGNTTVARVSIKVSTAMPVIKNVQFIPHEGEDVEAGQLYTIKVKIVLEEGN